MKKLVKILPILLIAIISIGTIGINILSYCCNHKEMSLLITSVCNNDEASHNHHSHCATACICCSHTPHAASGDCCSDVAADHDETCVLSSQCTKSNYLQLKPLKISEYAFALYTPIPVEIELFDFDPMVIFDDTTTDFIAFIPPPHKTGRVILAEHNTLII